MSGRLGFQGNHKVSIRSSADRYFFVLLKARCRHLLSQLGCLCSNKMGPHGRRWGLETLWGGRCSLPWVLAASHKPFLSSQSTLLTPNLLRPQGEPSLG